MNNKSLKMIIIALTILTIGLTGYIIYDKITEKDLSNVNNNVDNQINNNDEQEEQNSTEENNENKNGESNNTENNKEYNYEDFIRDETLILFGPSCLGLSEPLIAYINNDNDIVISGSSGKFAQSDKERKVNNIIQSANAKYLYKVGVISCDSIDLYYINNNNELYLIDNNTILYGDNLSKGKKVTNSKVVEFLGEEHKEYESYIKVLLEDGTVEYIKYFEISEEFR